MYKNSQVSICGCKYNTFPEKETYELAVFYIKMFNITKYKSIICLKISI